MGAVLNQLADVAETSPSLLEAELDTNGKTSPIKSRVAQLAGCSVGDLVAELALSPADADSPVIAMLASAASCSPRDLLVELP